MDFVGIVAFVMKPLVAGVDFWPVASLTAVVAECDEAKDMEEEEESEEEELSFYVSSRVHHHFLYYWILHPSVFFAKQKEATMMTSSLCPSQNRVVPTA